MSELVISLPNERSKPSDYDEVSKLLLVGHQGTGKTSACAALPNSFIIDLESGYKSYYEGMSIDVKALAGTHNTSLGAVFIKVLSEIKVSNAELGKAKYDYIIYDGLTALEKLAHQKATAMFKNSVVGKGMLNKGTVIQDVVTDVPESGWLWLHRAWDELYQECLGLAGKCTIFIGHAKQGSLVKQGANLNANDLNLTGKLKLNLLRDVDASGMVYKTDNQVKVSFKTNEKDLVTKARARHLRDKEILLTELSPEGKLSTHWEEIFKDLK